MGLENIRVKNIKSVIRYSTTAKKWQSKNRKDHFVGLQLSGSYYHDLGYKNFVLSRNCVYFFNQRDDYSVEAYELGEAISIHFTTYEDIDVDSFCIPISNPEEILGILEKAELKKGTSAEGELMTMSLLYRLLSEAAHIREKTYFPKDKRISDAKDYMDTHFRENGCLIKAIELSGLTARRFCDLFKGICNTTPNRYLVVKKVEYAKELLRAGGLSVAQIAELCGFSDVYYFSKVFKRETGIAPSRWK